MDDVIWKVCYEAGRLQIATTKDKYLHMWDGIPTDDEIIEIKKELDKAFEKWLNQ